MPWKRILTPEQIEALDSFEREQYASKRQTADMICALETIARLRIDLARTCVQVRQSNALLLRSVQVRCPPDATPETLTSTEVIQLAQEAIERCEAIERPRTVEALTDLPYVPSAEGSEVAF